MIGGVEVAWVGGYREGVALSDRLVSTLGADLVLVILRALEGGASAQGLIGVLDRVRQVAAEAQEAAQVAAVDAQGPETLDQIAQILGDVDEISVSDIVSDMARRAFSPEMSAWKLDVMDHVEIDGQPAAEWPGLTASDVNHVCWTVAVQAGFFPWPAGSHGTTGEPGGG